MAAQIHDVISGNAHEPRALAEYKTLLLMPNRFPDIPGHSLLISRRHRNPNELSRFYLARQRLRRIFSIADQLDSVIVANHPLAGMSIPDHPHVHLLPGDSSLFDIMRKQMDIATARERLSSNWLIAGCTPFATLLGSFEREENAAERVMTLFDKLHLRQVVFTFVYFKNKILITPRRKHCEKRHVGECMAGLRFNPDRAGVMAHIELSVPFYEEFDWSDLIADK